MHTTHPELQTRLRTFEETVTDWVPERGTRRLGITSAPVEVQFSPIADVDGKRVHLSVVALAKVDAEVVAMATRHEHLTVGIAETSPDYPARLARRMCIQAGRLLDARLDAVARAQHVLDHPLPDREFPARLGPKQAWSEFRRPLHVGPVDHFAVEGFGEAALVSNPVVARQVGLAPHEQAWVDSVRATHGDILSAPVWRVRLHDGVTVLAVTDRLYRQVRKAVVFGVTDEEV
ncbi:MAG: hypothetical protein D6683_17620 [Actinomyces sp.]|nr:MAG: hypothetical protein D6683_17620 [Actinomyces sp.]